MQSSNPSLSLLLPERYSSPDTTPSPQALPDAPNSRIADDLIRLSRSFEDVIQNGPAERLAELTERYISPNFCARFDTAFIASWEEYVRVLRIWVHSNPNYQKAIVATSCNIEEEDREASVYILIEVTGWPVQLKRLVVSVLKWKKRKRRWLCYENSTMRGIDTFATGAE